MAIEFNDLHKTADGNIPLRDAVTAAANAASAAQNTANTAKTTIDGLTEYIKINGHEGETEEYESLELSEVTQIYASKQGSTLPNIHHIAIGVENNERRISVINADTIYISSDSQKTTLKTGNNLDKLVLSSGVKLDENVDIVESLAKNLTGVSVLEPSDNNSGVEFKYEEEAGKDNSVRLKFMSPSSTESALGDLIKKFYTSDHNNPIRSILRFKYVNTYFQDGDPSWNSKISFPITMELNSFYHFDDNTSPVTEDYYLYGNCSYSLPHGSFSSSFKQVILGLSLMIHSVNYNSTTKQYTFKIKARQTSTTYLSTGSVSFMVDAEEEHNYSISE